MAAGDVSASMYSTDNHKETSLPRLSEKMSVMREGGSRDARNDGGGGEIHKMLYSHILKIRKFHQNKSETGVVF